ncbi:MAG: hypothetical protein ACE5GJ_01300 [Gemmatimonadota bacterium]
MRSFTDEDGRMWTAAVAEDPEAGYKGRYYLVFRTEDGEMEAPLGEVRWNSVRSGERTLATMSEWELRRRLHQAVGRLQVPVPG